VPANERSLDDQPETNVRGRRRRLLVHAGLFAVAGLACLTLAPTSTGAAPTVQDGRFLTAGTIDVDYTCGGGDPATILLLSQIGLSSFVLPVSITSVAVDPSPSPGEDFDIDFIWDVSLPQSLVDRAILAGATSLLVTSTNRLTPVTGATGAPLVVTGDPNNVVLGDGTVPVGYQEGPFTGTFNRTAAVDTPIEFVPGVITSAVVTQPSNVPLTLTCNVEGTPVLVLNDQTGTPPTTTTTTRPEVVVTTAPPTPTTAAVDDSGALPVTGSSSSNLFLVLLALGLIDVGYLALSASRSPRSGRASSVS
jgi:hypothetical protein